MISDANKAVVCDGQAESRKPKGLISLALGFLLVDFLLLDLPHFLPALHMPGTHWNWSGKIISIAFSCMVLACSPWLRRNTGLRWRQSPGSVRVSLVCFLACLGAGIAMASEPQPRRTGRRRRFRLMTNWPVRFGNCGALASRRAVRSLNRFPGSLVSGLIWQRLRLNP